MLLADQNNRYARYIVNVSEVLDQANGKAVRLIDQNGFLLAIQFLAGDSFAPLR